MQGRIGAALQCFDVNAVGWIEGNTNRGTHISVIAIEMIGAGQDIDDALGQQVNPGGIGCTFQYNIELVAADACNGINTGQKVAQASCHFNQQAIASTMPETLIDGLEVIQIDKQQGKFRLIVFRVLDRMQQQFTKQGAIGQSRQGIAMGEKIKPLFCLT